MTPKSRGGPANILGTEEQEWAYEGARRILNEGEASPEYPVNGRLGRSEVSIGRGFLGVVRFPGEGSSCSSKFRRSQITHGRGRQGLKTFVSAGN